MTGVADSCIAADVGGTFTDVVGVVGPTVLALKLLSSPPAYEAAMAQGVEVLADRHGVDLGAVGAFRHAATVATNAILEHTGARTALLTTRGFADVLEIGRLRRPDVFDIRWRKPAPLVPRRLRFEVTERVDHRGQVLVPFHAEEVEAAAEAMAAAGVESVAVALLNAHVNSGHEHAAAAIVRDRLPGVPVSVSSDVLPEVREYERTSTTAVNAYVRPVVETYLGDLRAALARVGVRAPVHVMQSSGGLTSAERAASQPVRTVESGPAAGVMAAAHLARRTGEPRVLAFDMGGTTAKASLVTDGWPAEVTELEVGAGMNANRLAMGRGYSVRMPSIDIVEVGGGGGSIFWLDAGGRPHVGPESAGASPGPVCYRLGGQRVTVTDANIVLGYLNQEQIAGGSQLLDPGLAVKAIDEQVAGPLGLSIEEAAAGVVRLVNANMGRALRAVSIERGMDPRDHVLVAFGGAGPMHAVAMARQFDIPRIVVPPRPGLFSALGLLVAQTRHDRVRGYPDRATVDVEVVDRLLRGVAEDAVAAVAAEPVSAAGGVGAATTVERRLDVCYAGQSFELQVPVPEGAFDKAAWEAALASFHERYAQIYGHAEPGAPVHLVNVRASARRADESALDAVWSAVAAAARTDGAVTPGERYAYFGRETGWLRTPVLPRSALGADAVDGPVVIEDMDATTVVPPGDRATVDVDGNIVVDLRGGGT